jgi:hypothetical protein
MGAAVVTKQACETMRGTVLQLHGLWGTQAWLSTVGEEKLRK